MNCSQCGATLGEGDAFCGQCGTPVTQPVAAPAPAAAPPPPAYPAPSQPPAYPQPAVASEPAPTPQVPPQPGAFPAQAAQVPAPAPAKSKTGLIVGIVAAVLVALGVLIAVVVLVVVPRFKAVSTPDDSSGGLPAVTATASPSAGATDTTGATETTATGASSGSGATVATFPTPEDAARSKIPANYVLKLYRQNETGRIYWAGPPASEWDTKVYVRKVATGWEVLKVTEFTPPTSESGDSDAGSQSEDGASLDGAKVARALVTRFLTAIKENRPEDAQRDTISPFRDDPASAQYADGKFTKFAIDRVEARGDDTYWVYTTEVWTYGTDKWRYDVVPTEAGYRIRELAPAAQ